MNDCSTCIYSMECTIDPAWCHSWTPEVKTETMKTMMNDKKTVREVCAEANLQDWYTLPREESRSIHLLTKRIISAHEREMKQMHDCCDSLENEFDKKDAEIARLKAELKDYPELKYQYEQSVIDGNRKTMEISDMTLRIELMERALKPVMDLDMSKFGFAVDYGECFEAVREAQRIMKEGVAK